MSVLWNGEPREVEYAEFSFPGSATPHKRVRLNGNTIQAAYREVNEVARAVITYKVVEGEALVDGTIQRVASWPYEPSKRMFVGGTVWNPEFYISTNISQLTSEKLNELRFYINNEIVNRIIVFPDGKYYKYSGEVILHL
jgi:hypothetical protein